MENVVYLLQVSGCILVFYLAYITLFKKSTFFRANRIYLLAALLFSFAIPIADFASVPTDFHLPATGLIALPVSTQLHIKAEYVSRFSDAESVNFIAITYWVGFTYFLLCLSYGLLGDGAYDRD